MLLHSLAYSVCTHPRTGVSPGWFKSSFEWLDVGELYNPLEKQSERVEIG